MYRTQDIKGKSERKLVDVFTVSGSMKIHIELLHAIIDHLHLIVAHHPIQRKETESE